MKRYEKVINLLSTTTGPTILIISDKGIRNVEKKINRKIGSIGSNVVVSNKSKGIASFTRLARGMTIGHVIIDCELNEKAENDIKEAMYPVMSIVKDYAKNNKISQPVIPFGIYDYNDLKRISKQIDKIK